MRRRQRRRVSRKPRYDSLRCRWRQVWLFSNVEKVRHPSSSAPNPRYRAPLPPRSECGFPCQVQCVAQTAFHRDFVDGARVFGAANGTSHRRLHVGESWNHTHEPRGRISARRCPYDTSDLSWEAAALARQARGARQRRLGALDANAASYTPLEMSHTPTLERSRSRERPRRATSPSGRSQSRDGLRALRSGRSRSRETGRALPSGATGTLAARGEPPPEQPGVRASDTS